MSNDRFRSGLEPKKATSLGSEAGSVLFWGEFRRNNQRSTNQYEMTYARFRTTINGTHGFLHPHRGGGNFSTMDGHVGQFSKSEFYDAHTQGVAGNQGACENILGLKW
jgi:prepilin-type processing-associated H-X9-DG protein